jgi:hypothetical protein
MARVIRNLSSSARKKKKLGLQGDTLFPQLTSGVAMEGWFQDVGSVLSGGGSLPGSQPPSQPGSQNGGAPKYSEPHAKPRGPMSAPMPQHAASQSFADDVAGVHAVMISQGEYPIIDELPSGGQLNRQGVAVGDALVAVDSSPVRGLSLRVIKAMIEGPPDSLVKLILQRATGEKYEVGVLRTTTLADDVQLATYGELLQFIESPLGTEFVRMSKSDYEPGHELKSTHDQLCTKINAYKQLALGDGAARLAQSEHLLTEVTAERDELARKLDENFREGEKIIKDLRDTLQALDYKNQRLKAELDDVRRKEVTALTLNLRPMDNPPTDPAGRKLLEEQLQRELGDALKIEHTRVEVVGLHRGSVKADISILPDPAGQGTTAKQAADNLITQAHDATSELRKTPSKFALLGNVETVEVGDPQDWVVRLRATVDALQQEKSRLAQDLAAAQQDLEGLARHKDQRFSHTLQQLQEREGELERLQREVESQAEARKVQLETTTMQRYAIDSRALLAMC